MFTTSASYPSDVLRTSCYYGGPASAPSSSQLAGSTAPSSVVYPTPITLPATPAVSSNLLSTNASSFIGLNHMSPLPMRRYSYSGLPSSTSIADLHLNMHHNCAMAHENSIANLITETCQSISRTSDILNRQLSGEMLTLSCNNLTNLIDENVESDIVKYDLLNDLTTTAALTPLKYSNNLYTQSMKYPNNNINANITSMMPTATKSPYFNRPQSHFLSSDDYILSKPIFSKNYINPISSSYICDDHNTNYNNYMTTSHYHSPPSHYHYHSPHHNYHYASNPCLSSHHSYHNSPRHSYPIATTSANSNAFNRNYNYQSHHQQAFSSSRPPSISSLNRYNTANANNYSSSFHNQPYYRTSSRLDLDNPKGGEIKRQVSFKFDVDQMSFDP